MDIFRPHTMTWTVLGPAGKDAKGYPVEGTPISSHSRDCRFYSGGGANRALKEFKNEDNTFTKQVGQIRMDPSGDCPEEGQLVEIPGVFKGIIRQVHKGVLSWRLYV